MLTVKVLRRASVAVFEPLMYQNRFAGRKLCSGYCRRPPAVYENKALIELRVPNRFFGIRGFPHLKLGIRDFKAKSGEIKD